MKADFIIVFSMLVAICIRMTLLGREKHEAVPVAVAETKPKEEEKKPAAPVKVELPDNPVTSEKLFVTGYVVYGKRIQVQLSDGTVWNEKTPGLGVGAEGGNVLDSAGLWCRGRYFPVKATARRQERQTTESNRGDSAQSHGYVDVRPGPPEPELRDPRGNLDVSSSSSSGKVAVAHIGALEREVRQALSDPMHDLRP